MIKWIRAKLYDLVCKIFTSINIPEVPEEQLNQDDWNRVHSIAENEIRVSKKIRKYAVSQPQTPLNQERGGRSTLKVTKDEKVDLQKPRNLETGKIWLRRKLAGLEEYEGERN